VSSKFLNRIRNIVPDHFDVIHSAVNVDTRVWLLSAFLICLQTLFDTHLLRVRTRSYAVLRKPTSDASMAGFLAIGQRKLARSKPAEPTGDICQVSPVATLARQSTLICLRRYKSPSDLLDMHHLTCWSVQPHCVHTPLVHLILHITSSQSLAIHHPSGPQPSAFHSSLETHLSHKSFPP